MQVVPRMHTAQSAPPLTVYCRLGHSFECVWVSILYGKFAKVGAFTFARFGRPAVFSVLLLRVLEYLERYFIYSDRSRIA